MICLREKWKFLAYILMFDGDMNIVPKANSLDQYARPVEATKDEPPKKR